MEKVLTHEMTSVSEFKKNPNEALSRSESGAIAVLTNNKPSFYVLTPDLYEQISEHVWELTIAPTIKKRLASIDKTVKVSIEDL